MDVEQSKKLLDQAGRVLCGEGSPDLQTLSAVAARRSRGGITRRRRQG